MPPKKKTAAPPPRKIQRSQFFVHPRNQQLEALEAVVDPKDKKPFSAFPPREQRRHFLFNNDTGEAFAEWIGNVAVSLETGEELFTSRKSQESEDYDCDSWRRFDYSVPVFRREDDPTIYTDELMRYGVITTADFHENGAVLTDAKRYEWLEARKNPDSAGL